MARYIVYQADPVDTGASGRNTLDTGQWFLIWIAQRDEDSRSIYDRFRLFVLRSFQHVIHGVFHPVDLRSADKHEFPRQHHGFQQCFFVHLLPLLTPFIFV